MAKKFVIFLSDEFLLHYICTKKYKYPWASNVAFLLSGFLYDHFDINEKKILSIPRFSYCDIVNQWRTDVPVRLSVIVNCFTFFTLQNQNRLISETENMKAFGISIKRNRILYIYYILL